MICSEKGTLANRKYADATFNFMTQVCCKIDGNLCWSLVTLKQFSAAWGFSCVFLVSLFFGGGSGYCKTFWYSRGW